MRMTRWCGAFSAVVLMAGVMCGAEQGGVLRVKTAQGVVEGKREGEVRKFLGIPYAAPPVGALRWKPPMLVAQWKGVRDAKTFGSRCMQRMEYGDMIFRDPGISEDCLTLNVWTAAKNKGAKLPVMVWIYGGGYAAGGTSEPRQDGTSLARHGVVLVSMNYRLGIFGFFAHPGLSAESGQRASGNYGLLDQTAALSWVKKNIAAFGGDPENVTVFGESAGSYSVSLQMASPLAKGLFQRALGESGAALGGFGTREEVEAKDAAFAKQRLGFDTVEQLRAMPARELMETAGKKAEDGTEMSFGPDVDGYFLTEAVAEVYAKGKQNDVPLLAGWNRDEGGLRPATTVASFHAEVEKEYGDKAPRVLKAFAAANDAEAVRAQADLAGDRFIAHGAWRWLEAQVRTGKQPVYRYQFDLAPPTDPAPADGLTVYHSGEIQYVFGALDLLQGFAWRPEDRALSETMQRYWTNFARTGDPNGPGLAKWPVYGAGEGWPVMHLGVEVVAEKDGMRERELLLEEIK